MKRTIGPEGGTIRSADGMMELAFPPGVQTTSFRKVRDGYFEIVLDKKPAPGEYAFLVQQTGMASANGGVILFCFGVD